MVDAFAAAAGVEPRSVRTWLGVGLGVGVGLEEGGCGHMPHLAGVGKVLIGGGGGRVLTCADSALRSCSSSSSPSRSLKALRPVGIAMSLAWVRGRGRVVGIAMGLACSRLG